MEGKEDYLQTTWDYLAVMGRRKVWFLMPFLSGILISIFLILYLPKIYKSNTLILVEAQKVPQDIIQSAVTGTVEGRLSTIRQQILSRSLLQRMIDKYGLYQNTSPSLFDKLVKQAGLGGLLKTDERQMTSEETLERMRNNIDVKTMGKRDIVNAFSLSFEGSDPSTVMNVTNELASFFIEENLKIREQLVEGTTEFLTQELQNIKETLERQEKRIADFKRRYMGELPEQLDANLRALDRFQGELLSTQFARKSSRDRIMMLENTLGVIKNRISGGEGEALQHDTNLQLKLREKKRNLEILRLEFKEDYPDIHILKNQIQGLEEKLESDRMNESLAQSSIEGNENPSIVRSAVDQAPSVVDLQGQIRNTKTELGHLKGREEKLREQIRAYELRVESVPAREQELAMLLRDYNNTQKSYETLLDKKLTSEISENLEKRQKGEQFRILDPANLPEKPIKPNRQKIGLAGIVLGLGGGIALVFIREQFDSSLRKPEEVEKIVGVPVLVSIPDFTDEMEES